MPRKLFATVHYGGKASSGSLAPCLMDKINLDRDEIRQLSFLQQEIHWEARGAEGSHCDTPSEKQLKMCCSRLAGACAVGSPTEQLAGCPTPGRMPEPVSPRIPFFPVALTQPLSRSCQWAKHSNFRCWGCCPFACIKKSILVTGT